MIALWLFLALAQDRGDTDAMPHDVEPADVEHHDPCTPDKVGKQVDETAAKIDALLAAMEQLAGELPEAPADEEDTAEPADDSPQEPAGDIIAVIEP